MAKPGSILITTETLRLAEGYVRATALGPVLIKGLDAPVEGLRTGWRQWHPAALAGDRGRAGSRRFVGRDTESAALAQALEQAGAGHGQVVAVVGEAGVGKSRLTYEFLHSRHTQGWRVLESASVSYGKATPYFPVLDLLRRYAHVDERDDARTIRAKVTGQLLTLDEALQDAIAPLLALLDALPDDSPFLALDPPAAPPAHRSLHSNACSCARVRCNLVLLVFEDLHWLDTRDAGAARQPGGEPADGAAAAPGQLSPGVPAQLGRQDVLRAARAWTPCRRPARTPPAGPARGRPWA